MYKPSDTYKIKFFTSKFDTGNITDPDSTPLVKFFIGGVDQTTAAGAAITCGGAWPGECEVTATIPSSAAGLDVEVNVLAVVNSITGAQCLDHFKVVTNNTDDIYTSTLAIEASTSGAAGVDFATMNSTISDSASGITRLKDSAFGKWEINTDVNTLTLYSQGGVVIETFDLTPATNGEFVAREPRNVV